MKKQLLTIAIIMLFAAYAKAQWVNTTSGTANTLRDVYFFDANNGLVVGNGLTIQKTTNGGSSWAPINIITQPQISGTISSISFADNLGVAVGNFGNSFVYLKSIDGGNTWAGFDLSISAILNDICFNSADIAFACGDNGKILKSNNIVNSWTELNSNLTNDLNSINFLDANTGFAVGNNGAAIKTTDGGNNWTTLYNGGDTINYTAVQFVNADTGFIIGSTNSDRSYLLATYDGGSSWLAPLNMQVKQLNDIFFLNDNIGYVVGGEPTQGTNSQYIAKTTDAGFTWQQQVESNPRQLQAVFFVDALTGYAVGDNGTIIKTTTGGGITGIEEKENKFLASVAPNPVENKLVLTLQKLVTTAIYIYDTQGKLWHEESLIHSKEHIINTEKFPAGMYVIKVKQANEVWFEKIMKL